MVALFLHRWIRWVHARLSPNPTAGRREDSGRRVREPQGGWPGLHWGRREVGRRSSVAAQGPYGRLRKLRCAGMASPVVTKPPAAIPTPTPTTIPVPSQEEAEAAINALS